MEGVGLFRMKLKAGDWVFHDGHHWNIHSVDDEQMEDGSRMCSLEYIEFKGDGYNHVRKDAPSTQCRHVSFDEFRRHLDAYFRNVNGDIINHKLPIGREGECTEC